MTSKLRTYEIVLNGKTAVVQDGASIGSLLDEREIERRMVAVELNGEIIPRYEYDETPDRSRRSSRTPADGRRRMILTATATTTIFDQLTSATAELHSRTLSHPMVKGIGDGSLAGFDVPLLSGTGLPVPVGVHTCSSDRGLFSSGSALDGAAEPSRRFHG